MAYQVDRVPLILRYSEGTLYSETYGFSGKDGNIVVEGQRLTPRGVDSDTLLVFMHPISGLNLLPFPNALAESGMHVLCANGRYPRNDTALIMEKVLVDLGQYVRFARAELGYRKVVLVGWSGGGALSLFYQAEAEHPTVVDTPAGDPIDLTRADLSPADGLIIVAAHRSRAKILTEWLDPSVTDEMDPDRREAAFDLYGPSVKPPYSADFIAEFRARQVARNRRITGWVRDTLEALKSRGDGEIERGFVVHRTMAEPRWLDLALDPNDRAPDWCFLGDPRTVNVGPTGLARFSSLRSWLSQWSFDDSRADAVTQAARISPPCLLIENSADDAVPATHLPAIRDALRVADLTYHRIEGATHYYAGQPAELARAVELARGWLSERGFT